MIPNPFYSGKNSIYFLLIIVGCLFIFGAKNHVSKGFADSPELYLPWPSGKSVKISRGFYNISPSEQHWGVDFSFRENANVTGDWVLASADGVVVERREGWLADESTEPPNNGGNGGWGSTILIDHGGGYYTRYAHLDFDRMYVQNGDIVVRGQILGEVGNTGKSDYDHIHAELYQGGSNPVINRVPPVYVECGGCSPDDKSTFYTSQNVIVAPPNTIQFFSLPISRSFTYPTSYTFQLLPAPVPIISAVAIQRGGFAYIYKYAYETSPYIYLDQSEENLLDNTFSDGSSFNGSISAYKFVRPQCIPTLNSVGASSFDESCSPGPTPTSNPGGSTPTPPPPTGTNWSARYFDGSTCWNDTNCPIQPRCTSTIGGPELHADYGTGAPCSGMSGDNWVGDYLATLNFPAGDYVFQLINDDGGKVWLNGVNIQDRGNSSSDPVCPARHLDGNANLRVLLREDGGDAKVHLTWTTDTRICDGGAPATGRWQVKYYNYDKNNPSSKSECTPNSSEASFDGTYLVKDWRNNSPGGNCQADFVAEITGRMLFEANKQYTFHLNADDAAWIEVYGHKRGNLVIDRDPDDRTSPSGMTSPVESIEFWDTAERDIRLYFRDNSGDAIVQAWWEGPGLYPLPNDTLDPQQWFVEYWQNRHLWTDSVARRNEGMSDTIDYLSWGMNGPGFGIGSDQFSVQFRRTIPFTCGNYRFVLDHDDGVRFYVDDVLKLDRWIDGGLVDTVDMFLPQGNHNLKIQHYENTGAASFNFDFSRLNTIGCTVDLNAIAPSGWTAPIFLSNQPGTQSNNTLTVGQPVYVDIGYQNSGTAESASHFVDLFVDGAQYRREWISVLTAGNSNRLLDLPIVVDTVGTHTIQVILDPENAISEGNEANNIWSGQFTWQAAPTPTETPTPTNTPVPVVPTPVYGSGRDGDLVVAAGQTYTFCDGAKSFCTWMENGASAGQPTIVVNSTSGLATGDEVLIVHIRHLANYGAGNYEFATIAAIGADGKTITLNRNLTNSYDTSVTHIHSRVQIVKVPHFNNVTIQSGGTFGVRPWNDRTGGGVTMRVAGQLVVQGTLDVKGNPGPFNLGDGDLIGGGIGAGFAGGKSRNQHQLAYQGEGDVGPSYPGGSANGTGGGGAYTTGTADSGSSGGGGSHATAGTNGTARGAGGPGEGANRIVGNPELTLLFFGGGGGGGSMDQNAAGGPGGAGGGVAVLFAKQISVTGVINASGGDGGYSYYSSGGGGAGGSILLKGDVVNVGTARVVAINGKGWAKAYSTGGNGGYGRIRIEYGTQLTGNTFPAASTAQADILVPTSTPTQTPTSANTSVPSTPTYTPTLAPTVVGETILESFESGINGWLTTTDNACVPTIESSILHVTQGAKSALLKFNFIGNSDGRCYYNQNFEPRQNWTGKQKVVVDFWKTGAPISVTAIVMTGAWVWQVSETLIPLVDGNNTVEFDLAANWSGRPIENLADVVTFGVLLYPENNGTGEVYIDNIRLQGISQSNPTNTPIPPTATHTSTATETATAINTPTVTSTTMPPTATSSAQTIFADNFELGNFSTWTANKTDSGDLAISSTAAIVGAKGLQAVIDDNVTLYLTDDKPNQENDYRVRFYFDPNSISMAQNNAHVLFYGYQGASKAILRIEFRFQNGKYQLRAGLLNDGSTWSVTNWYVITDSPHFIELEWHAASGVGTNNGNLKFWIDEQELDTLPLSNIDNDTRRIDRVRIGSVSGIDSGTRGTYYFDAFDSRRGGHIGPMSGTDIANTATSAAFATGFLTQTIAPDKASQLSVLIGDLGIELKIPVNSVESPTTILITGTTDNTMPDGYVLVGNKFEIKVVDGEGSDVLGFLQNYDLNVNIGSINASGAAIASSPSLTFQVWNIDNETWEIIPSVLNSTQDTITMHLDRPGTIGVFQVESQDEESPIINVYLPVVQR